MFQFVKQKDDIVQFIRVYLEHLEICKKYVKTDDRDDYVTWRKRKMRIELKKTELRRKIEGGQTLVSNRHRLYVVREPDCPPNNDLAHERKSEKTNINRVIDINSRDRDKVLIHSRHM